MDAATTDKHIKAKNTKRWAVHPDGSRLRFKIHTSFKDFSVEKLHEVLRSLLASASGGCGCTVLAHSFVLTARFFHVVPFRKRHPCSMGYFNVQTPRLYFDSSLTYLSFWSIPTMMPGILGLPTIEGNTARGASSPAKSALHMPLTLSTTSAATSSSAMFTGMDGQKVCGQYSLT